MEKCEITVNGIQYVPKDSMQPALKDGKECVIIRTYSAGVHFGYLKSKDGKEVELINSRRVYYWDGAASLSQMAVDGVSKPENCKFSVVVESITLTEAIEIIPVTKKAEANLFNVQQWRK